jgi:hypothetical protein
MSDFFLMTPRGGGYMPYEEEDTCHMRRRIHVI